MSQTHFTAVLCRGTTTGSTEVVFQARDGVAKFHNRPTAADYVVEIKGEPTKTSGAFDGAIATIDAKPSASSTAGIRALSGVARLAATYTMTGGNLIGSYAQICNLGTLNGASILTAAQYSLVADGGTYTAVGHLAAQWLDSQLSQTVSAGLKSFQYITNNGTTTWDNVMYVYAGNKITNFLTIESTTDSGIVGEPVTSDYTFTKTRLLKVNIGGETGYIVVDVP
jgi:hypothetical protein